jgi:MSHA biogenesis protein MshN
MSVVNKMLQDLEARRADGEQISADYQPPRRSYAERWKWLALLLASGILVYWIYTLWQTKPQSQVSADAVISSTVQPKTVTRTAQTGMVETQQMSATSVTEVMPETPDESPLAELESQAKQSVVTEQASIETPVLISTNSEIVEEGELLAAGKQVPQETISKPVTDTSNLAVRSSQTSAQESQSQKQAISDALAANDTARAIRLLQAYIDVEPTNSAAIKKLATLWFANGNVSAAAQLLQKQLDLQPEQSDFRLMLARLYSQQNKPTEAMQLLSTHKPQAYLEVDYLAFRATLAQQLDVYQTALSDYQQLTQLENNNAKWWLGLAVVNDKLNQVEAALAAYRQARALAQLDGAVDQFMQQRITILAGNS